MIISSSDISMSSSHEMNIKSEKRESLSISIDGLPAESEEFRLRPPNSGADVVSLSNDAKALQCAPACGAGDDEIGPMEDVKLTVVKLMIEALTGKKIKIMSARDLLRNNSRQPQAVDLAEGAKQARTAPSAGFSLEYSSHELRQETETASFSAKGVVRTADGREIAFSTQVNMSRQFIEEKELSLRAGDAAKLTDPLVVNFNAPAAKLSQSKFSFDLDSDGVAEQISLPAPGSGFLALDRNNDGIINNGGELFGAKTGDGFQELAQYDVDANNWIDENDPIYDGLRIWSTDEKGESSLLALGQLGIGAVYLGAVDTEFSLTNGENELQGQVRSSGVFLREDGSAGSIQQVDLVA